MTVNPVYDLVAWFVVVTVVVVYRRRERVRSWLASQWLAFEDRVRVEMAKLMSKDLRMEVEIGALELRLRGVFMRRLEMWDETCTAYIDALDFETSGGLNLISLGGVHWMGSPRVPFGAGFTVREVDAITMSRVRVEMMEESWRSEPGSASSGRRASTERLYKQRTKNAASRPSVLRSMLMTKHEAQTYSKERKDAKRRRRLEFARKFADRWGPLDDEADFLATAVKPYPDGTWRIGRFLIVDMTLDLYGNQLHLDSFETRAFVGDTDRLQSHLGYNVLQEVVGPRGYLKHAKHEFEENSRQFRHDINVFVASARRDFRHFNLRRSLTAFLYKNPQNKARHVRAWTTVHDPPDDKKIPEEDDDHPPPAELAELLPEHASPPEPGAVQRLESRRTASRRRETAS